MHNPNQLAASIRDDRENFEVRYNFGRVGEREIIIRLRRGGHTVIELAQIAPDCGGAPSLLTPTSEIIATDLFVFNSVISRFVECKRKATCGWFRKKQCFTSGINLHHYLAYRETQKLSPQHPVWVFFLHEGGKAKDAPYLDSPCGLFGKKITDLAMLEDHRSDHWGKSGMVYWQIKDLEPLDNEAKESFARFGYALPVRPTAAAMTAQEAADVEEQLALWGSHASA